jgi:hypothetical protein
MGWFRYHVSDLDNPAVQRLPGDLFKIRLNLLCLASRQRQAGALPSLDDIAFALRLPAEELERATDDLVERGFLARTETGFAFVDWSARQFLSDSSTPRVKRFRERRRNVSEDDNETFSQPRRNRAETPSDSDSDTDTDSQNARAGARGTQASQTPVDAGEPKPAPAETDLLGARPTEALRRKLEAERKRAEELEAYEAFRETAHRRGWTVPVPAPRGLTPGRRSALRKMFDGHGLDAWRQALAMAASSEFLAGQNWFSVDWLLKGDNLLKVLEGAYSGKGGRTGAAGAEGEGRADRDRDWTKGAL